MNSANTKPRWMTRSAGIGPYPPRGGLFSNRRPGYLPRDHRGQRRSSSGAWIVGLIVLVLLGLGLWYFLSRGSDTAATTTQGTAATTAVSVRTGSGEDVLAVAGDASALSSMEGQTVTGTDVPVADVKGDGAFISGADGGQIYVFLGSPPSGPTIDFTGTLQPLPLDYQTRFDLGSEAGAFSGTHYIDASTE